MDSLFFTCVNARISHLKPRLLLSIDIPARCACQKCFVCLCSTGETVFDGASLNLIIFSCFRANKMICSISRCDRAFLWLQLLYISTSTLHTCKLCAHTRSLMDDILKIYSQVKVKILL